LQYENYKQHKAVYHKYRQLDPKKREAYRDKHEDEIQKYKDAKQYPDGVRGDHKTLPQGWQAEQKTLTAAKFALCEGITGYRTKCGAWSYYARGRRVSCNRK
jgi:hypothetical protein